MNKRIAVSILCLIAVLTSILSLSSALAQYDEGRISSTYVIDCAKGSEFGTDLTVDDIVYLRYEGQEYELNMRDFCKNEFVVISGKAAAVKEVTTALDLTGDGYSDVYVTFDDCVSGVGALSVELASARSVEVSATEYVLSFWWLIILALIILCVAVVIYKIEALRLRLRRRRK